VRGQERLEDVIDEWEQVKVQQWQVRVHLHELEEGPQRQCCDSRLKNDDYLHENEASQVPIHLYSKLTEKVHERI
jgi:hypothetical protein